MSLISRIMSFTGIDRFLGLEPKLTELAVDQAFNKVPPAGMINYVLNDYSTPTLIKTVAPPTTTGLLPFTVTNYKGGGFAPNSKEGRAANTFYSIYTELNWVKAIGGKVIRKWPGTASLKVVPEAGRDLNAYYNRKGLFFFFDKSNTLGRVLFTADSPEIVCHELGHALLDAFRPETWSASFIEVWALHEAFGDVVAFLNVLEHDEVMQYVLAQTQGNLSKPSVASNLAEDMGVALGIPGGCLRSMINTFNYVNPKTLPSNAPDDQLSKECHNFSRVFSGAIYDLFLAIYNKHVAANMSQLDALRTARNVVRHYFVRAVQVAPVNARFYESVAKAMVWVDKNTTNKPYHAIINSVFQKRKILPAVVKLLDAPPCYSDENIVIRQNDRVLKLSDHLIRAQASSNPLYGVELELPQADAYFYDADKNFIDSVTITDDATLEAAEDMIDYLHETKAVSDSPKTPFEISNNRLVRTYFD